MVPMAGYLCGSNLVPEAQKLPGKPLIPSLGCKLRNAGSAISEGISSSNNRANQQGDGREGQQQKTPPFYLSCWPEGAAYNWNVPSYINQGNKDSYSGVAPYPSDSNFGLCYPECISILQLSPFLKLDLIKAWHHIFTILSEKVEGHKFLWLR